MAVTDTQLLLRLSADVQKFQKQMARITAAGQATAVETEARFRSAHGQMAKSAEKSADAIGREMDRLRTKYDPVYAASKKYESSLYELNRAQKVGALSSTQHEAALERLNAEYAASTGMTQRAAASTTALAAANTRTARTTRGLGGGIQNVSYQVQDLAVQLSMGTTASIALGQQLPQLLGGFGIMGAVLGAVVAVGVPVASMFLNMGDAGETLQEKIEALEAAVDDYRSASERAVMPTADLAEKYGTATGAAREFIAALREISEVTALEQLDATIDAIATKFGSLSMGAVGDGMSGMGSEYEETLRTIRREMELTGEQSLRVVKAMRDMEAAKGPQEAVKAAEELSAALLDAHGTFEDMPQPARDVYNETQKAAKSAAELSWTAGDAASALSGAASEAGRLADELGRAVGNAMNLATQGISDLRRAEIEYEYRDDPVGKAGALTRQRYSDTVGDTTGFDPVVQEGMAQQEEQIVRNSMAVEEYRQKLKDWQDQQREAAKEANKKPKKGKKLDPLFQASDEELLSIERRIEMIGMEASEIAALNAKYALLDEAKRRDLDVDARQAKSGETIREEIERQAGAIERLSEKYDGAKMRADFFADAQRTVQDGMIDAIVEGENLAGVLGNVAKMFARAAIEASLFGQGGLSNDGGGGLLGGVLAGLGGLGGGGKALDAAGLMSGGRAAGGPVTAGKMYRVNEHGGEAFMPAVNGRVLSLAQTQQMQGQGAAPISVSYAPVIDARNMAAEDVRRLETVIAQDRAAFEGRLVETLARTGRYGVTRKVLRRG